MLAVCFIAITCACYAQDIIVTKDSRRYNALVTEVNVDNVRFKMYENQDGPVYTLPKSDIVTIIYRNGNVETFQTSAQTAVPAAAQTPVQSANFAQTQSALTYKGGVRQNGVRLTPIQVRDVMSGNSEALNMYNSGQTLGMTGMIFSGIGGGLIGWHLGSRLAGGEGNSSLVAAGAVSIGIGFGFALVGDANIKKSVELYNSKLSSNSVPYHINFGFTQTGVGFSMRF